MTKHHSIKKTIPAEWYFRISPLGESGTIQSAEQLALQEMIGCMTGQQRFRIDTAIVPLAPVSRMLAHGSLVQPLLSDPNVTHWLDVLSEPA
jgi:hypothetical protein